MAFSLKATLGLDSTKFQRGIGNARRSLNKSVGGMMTSLAPIAGFIGFSSLASGALDAARDITTLSGVANANAETFQKNAFAAKTVRIEQEKLADIYKDTGDKIGDFLQTGGGPLADFFENIAPKIGVTAEQFRNLSGPDALQLYYDSLEKANLSQNEMTFFMEAIASDATALIPLLKDGGEGFKTLGEQAEKAGLIMSDLERKQLEKVNMRLDVMKKRATILSGTFLTKLFPAVNILKNGLQFLGDQYGILAAIVVGFGEALGKVIVSVIQPAITAYNALALAVEAGAQAMAGNGRAAVQAAKKAKQAFGEIATDVKEIPAAMKQAGEDMSNTFSAAYETLGDTVETRNAAIMESFDDILGKGEDTADSLAAAFSKPPPEKSTGTSSKGDGKGRMIELEQKLRKMKLMALKAEAKGEIEVAKAMQKKVEMAEKILKIMRETGASQAEAQALAAKTQALSSGKTEPQAVERNGDTPRQEIHRGVKGQILGKDRRNKVSFKERMRQADLKTREKFGPTAFLGTGGVRKPEDVSTAGKDLEKTVFKESLETTETELAKVNSTLSKLDATLKQG